MKNTFKKDYAPQFNKAFETRSVTAKEAFEMVSQAAIITLGTYVILGFLGLL